MMPRLTIYGIRAALCWFVVGITVGMLMMIDMAVGLNGVGSRLLHVHIHIMLFGWFVQIIIAVAYWMLPRFGRERPRAWLAVVSILALNAASLTAIGFRWFHLHIHTVVWILEVLAFLFFAVHAWPRIKNFGAT